MGTSPKHHEACLRSNALIAKQIRDKYESCPKICKKCEGPIPYDKRSRLYCSDECTSTSGTRGGSVRRPRAICATPECNKEVGGSRSKYCTRQCSANHRGILARDGWLIDGNTPGPGVMKKHLKSILDECWCCGISDWNDKPLVLELEHKDGNADNNSVENIELLCPNCHSQTSTYKNRNNGNGRVARRERAQKDYHRGR